MKQAKTLNLTMLIGWLITALAIASIAPLLVPELSRSDYFWLRVAWTEMLNAILWSSLSFFLFVSGDKKDSTTRYGGISPTISLITGAYAILSFSAMVAHSLVPSSDISSRIHWISQILFLTVTAVLIVFLTLARTTAISGVEFDRIKAVSPKQLHDLIRSKETLQLSQELRERLKHLREAIAYSLHESETLSGLSDYQELSSEIIALCNEVDSFQNIRSANADIQNPISQSALALTNKVRHIASQQIRS